MFGSGPLLPDPPSTSIGGQGQGCPSNEPGPATPDLSDNSGTAWESGQDDSRTGKRTWTALANVSYARVSTLDQDLALQLDALAAAGCTKMFEDCAFSTRTDRVDLRDALDYVRDGEVLIVWKLDRLRRSLSYLVTEVSVQGLPTPHTSSHR